MKREYDEQQTNYQYPASLEKAQMHRNSTIIFKDVYADEAKKTVLRQKCECCGRLVGHPPQKSFRYDPLQLAIYGPGLPLFFYLLLYVMLLLLVCIVIFGLFAFFSNLSGNNCEKHCFRNSIVYRWSILNHLNNLDVILVQKYIIVVLIVVLVVLLQKIRLKLREEESHIDQFLVSPSDYSVFVRRIPHNATERDLQQMVNKIKPYLSRQEAAETQNLAVETILMTYRLEQFHQIEDTNLENFKKSVESGSEFTKIPYPKFEEFADSAIIIFKHDKAKKYFLTTASNDQNLIRYFWRDYVPLSDVHQVRGEFVAVSRAPEPDDIIWDNLGYSMKDQFCRKVFSMALSLSVLALGIIIQYFIAKYRYDNIEPQETVLQFFYSFATALFITAFNYLIEIILIWATDKEKVDTTTNYEISLTKKIVFLQFLNSGVFMVLVNVLVYYSSVVDSKKSLIPMDIFQLMVLNALLNNLITFVLYRFEVLERYGRYKLNKGQEIFTQTEANHLMEAPKVQLVYKYAYIFKTFWLTAFFLPTIPSIIGVSFVGLLLNYWIEKYLFSGVYKAPYMISSEFNREILNLLEETPLWITIGSFMIHYIAASFNSNGVPGEIVFPHVICLIISLFCILFPFEAASQRCCPAEAPQPETLKPYSEAKKNFQITYPEANPAYSLGKKHHKEINIFRESEIVGAMSKIDFGIQHIPFFSPHREQPFLPVSPEDFMGTQEPQHNNNNQHNQHNQNNQHNQQNHLEPDYNQAPENIMRPIYRQFQSPNPYGQYHY